MARCSCSGAYYETGDNSGTETTMSSQVFVFAKKESKPKAETDKKEAIKPEKRGQEDAAKRRFQRKERQGWKPRRPQNR